MPSLCWSIRICSLLERVNCRLTFGKGWYQRTTSQPFHYKVSLTKFLEPSSMECQLEFPWAIPRINYKFSKCRNLSFWVLLVSWSLCLRALSLYAQYFLYANSWELDQTNRKELGFQILWSVFACQVSTSSRRLGQVQRLDTNSFQFLSVLWTPQYWDV